MSSPAPDQFAAVSDIHGNRWALEAVLDDLGGREIEHVVNLGDCFYGPLDPAGTAEILIPLGWPTVRGNEDRLITDPGGDSPTLRFVRSELGTDHLSWLAKLSLTTAPFDTVFMFHGTPENDSRYLLHTIRESGAAERPAEDIAGLLRAVTQPLVLCGHDHLPRRLRINGRRTVVNPGSVGLQAYTDDNPYPHAMQAGSPGARYAVLTRDEAGWQADQIDVPYDWNSAAGAAAKNGRDDWAAWLRTGTARIFGDMK
jgi:predicted phosphodiesterase